MIQEVVRQWDMNKDNLKRHIVENKEMYRDMDYEGLVKNVIDIILNGGNPPTVYSSEDLTVIDDGDYQGTMLFAIPARRYQPDETDYIFTYVYYGSCSGCDTLQSVQEDWDEDFLEGFMTLSLHLIQKMKHLYAWGTPNE